MSTLTTRAYELAIDTLKVTGHRCSFRIERTLKPDPNVAEISVYNLTDEQRQKITEAKAPLVRLAAGYGKELTQLFYGQCIHVEHEVKDADIITHLTTGDGISQYQKARINLSFGPKTKIDTVLRALVKAFGLKPGNTEAIAKQLSKSLKAQIFLEGTAMSGSAASEMTALMRSAGLEWSIQDGAIQILDTNKAIDAFAIVLSPETGLVGSPSVSNKGIVSGVSLIIKDMIPGRQIDVQARFVRMRARLEKTRHIGDTHGDDWHIQWEAKNAQALKGSK